MLTSLWLPWADVRCSQISAQPDYWQLAGYDERLYALLALASILLFCGGWMLYRARRKLVACAASVSVVALVAWWYLWYKKDELAAYQAQLVAGGGDLGLMLQDLQVQLGLGFKMYLAGALAALAGALLCWKADAPDPPATAGS